MLKNRRDSFAGRSFLFNTLAIALNVLGVILIAIGFLSSGEGSHLLPKIMGSFILVLSLVALYLFKGWILYAYICRIIVGGVFIVSGLIKANDPKGFAYKLEEYFQDGALAYRIKGWFHWDSFSLEFLIHYALFIAIIICVIEILLGVLLILGSRIKSTSWLLLFMLLFFGFLTWHTKECVPGTTFSDVDTYAINSTEGQAKMAATEYNDHIKIVNKTGETVTIQETKPVQCVTDCGCFGDALKGTTGRSMTPQESFWKDLILLYLTLMIFIPRRKIGINSSNENRVMIISGMIIIGVLAYLFSSSFIFYLGLLFLLIPLWIKKVGGKIFGNEFGLILSSLLCSFLLIVYVLLFLPIKDYRPYAEGKNLIEEMHDGQPGTYKNYMVYSNKITHKDTLISVLDNSTKAIWGDTTNWEFKSRKTVTITPTIPPTIQQFNPSIAVHNLTTAELTYPPIQNFIDSNQVKYVHLLDTLNHQKLTLPLSKYKERTDDYEEYIVKDTIKSLNKTITAINLKDTILKAPQILLVISRDVSEGHFGRIDELKEITKKAKKDTIPILMITASTQKQVEKFRQETGLILPTLRNDNIEIKGMTRSNPTLMILKEGVVKGKYSAYSIPSWKWLKENILKLK